MTSITVAILRHLLLAAFLCGGASGGHAQSMAIPEKATLQLKWKHQFQFAGYYAALEKGFYRDAGFDVTIREAQEGRDPVDIVLAGEADYGVGASELVLRRVKGQPIVVLAAILQHSPLVLLARGRGVNSVHDLAGKRVMLLPHETELYAYLHREGLSRDRIVEVPHTFSPDDLVKGKVEALSAYSTDETFVLNQKRFQYSIFSPRSSGIDFYGDSLFTSEKLVKRDRARVAAFRQASLRGWQYAMDHPAEIADLIIARYGQRHSREHLLFEAEEMRRLMQPQLIEIGHMNPGRWQGMAQVYAEIGMLPQDASLKGFMFSAGDQDLMLVYRWLAAAIAIAVAGGLIAMRVIQLNRRLVREVTLRSEAEGELRRANEGLTRQLGEIQALKGRLEEQAIRDSLTGLYNRRYFDDAVERELARAQRERYPVSLAMIDIDHFKQFNDRYGHQAGDKVLQALAQYLNGATRVSDLVCRWGGEEFVVVLPQMALAAAMQRAETWRAGFGALKVALGAETASATISVGISAVPGEGGSAEELLHAADAALYRAKAEGRNRVCTVEPVVS